VRVGIASGRLRLGRRGVARIRLRCPRAEQSPPCRGRVVLRTRTRVHFRGKRRRVVLARGRFRIPAGGSRRVRLRLTARKARLVRRSRAGRRAIAIVRVRDAAGNRATARKRVGLLARSPRRPAKR